MMTLTHTGLHPPVPRHTAEDVHSFITPPVICLDIAEIDRKEKINKSSGPENRVNDG